MFDNKENANMLVRHSKGVYFTEKGPALFVYFLGFKFHLCVS